MMFKDILWEQGGVWFILLAMTIGFVIRQVHFVISAAKGQVPKD